MSENIWLILSDPAFSQALGWFFGAAMAIGGLINNGARKITGWITAGIVYAVAQESLRYYVLMEMGYVNNAYSSLTITLVTSIVYIVGIMAGWMVVYLARKRVRNKWFKEEKRCL